MVDVRRATEADAALISGLMAIVIGERVHSAIDQAWTTGEQQAYLRSLSSRAAVFLAEDAGGLAGIQTLDAWAPGMAAMAHVAQIGTFLVPAARRRGVGSLLFAHTRAFAEERGVEKLVVQIRASNLAAQSFYSRLGFERCGILRRQVFLDGSYDDEVLFEMFLQTPARGEQ